MQALFACFGITDAYTVAIEARQRHPPIPEGRREVPSAAAGVKGQWTLEGASSPVAAAAGSDCGFECASQSDHTPKRRRLGAEGHPLDSELRASTVGSEGPGS